MTADASQMFSTFSQVENRADQTASKLNGMGGFSLGGAVGFGAATNLGGMVTDGLRDAVGWGKDLVKQGYAANIEYTKTGIAIKQMVGGNAALGESLMKQAQQLAMESPFDVGKIADYTKRLLGAGVSAQQVIPTIKMLSDVAAGVGGDFDLIARAYTQVMAKGKLMAEELNGQFADQGLGAKVFADALQLPVDKFLEMVKNGEVGADKVTEAFAKMTSAGGKFYDMSKKMADANPFASISKSFNEIVRVTIAGADRLIGFTDFFKGIAASMRTLVSSSSSISKAMGPLDGWKTPEKPPPIAVVPDDVKKFVEDYKNMKPLVIGGQEFGGFGKFSDFRRGVAEMMNAINKQDEIFEKQISNARDLEQARRVGDRYWIDRLQKEQAELRKLSEEASGGGGANFDAFSFKIGRQFIELERSLKNLDPKTGTAPLIEANTQAAFKLADEIRAGNDEQEMTMERVEKVLRETKALQDEEMRNSRKLLDLLRKFDFEGKRLN